MASGLIRACLFVSLVVLVCFVAEDQALKMSLRKATTFKKYTLAEKSRALKHIAQKTFNTLMSRHKGHKKATKQSDASEGSDGCQIAAFEECFATTADMPKISGDMSLEDQSTFCSAAGLLDLCVSQQLNNAASCNEESEEHQIFEDGLSAVAFLAYVCGNDTLSVIVDNFDCVETVLSDETCFGVIDEGERSKSRKRQGDDSDTPEENADDCTLLQQFLECFANDAATTCGENAQLETIIEDLVKIFAAPYLGSVPDACNIDSDIIVRAAKIQRAQHKVDQKKSQLLDLLERLGQNKKSPFRTGFID